MGRLRVLSNRLCLRSWGVPFARNRRPSPEETPPPRRYNSIIASTTKKQDMESSSLHSPTPTHTTEPATPTSKLIELAQTITRETEKLNRFIKEKSLPEPSFDVDAPLTFTQLPNELKKSREEVMKATKELGELVEGPRESIRWMAWDHNNSLSLHFIYHYKVAQLVPLDKPISFLDLASLTSISEVNVRRLLRHAMTNRIFVESSPGFVAHTALSRVLATDPAINDWVGFCVEDMWPASSRTICALDSHPRASEPTQTGFCVANGTTDVEPMFQTFGKDPVRAKRMGGAMKSLVEGEGYEISYLVEGYDWGSLDAKGGTVVDLGGSQGFVCVELAKQFQNLKFVVQDLPKTITSAPTLEKDIKERIMFQEHDFFTTQKIKGADVYLFRWILHNYSDKYAAKILKALIPALKKGARVLINDYCLPEVGAELGMGEERVLRTMDLVMLTLLNAQERSESDFRVLFDSVDGRFRFVGVTKPRGCRMSILEAVWEG